MTNDPATIRECLLRASGWLSFGPHKDRARPDAELLLLHALGKDRTWLLTHGDSQPEADLWQHYFALLSRRLRGEPIQYITGECEFYGLPFRVNPSVLIPRPETEHLVERAAESVRGSQATRIVDVGTGSGAIAVALAHVLNSKRITAIDVSEEALQLARENAERNAVDVRFLRGDLLQPVAEETFDLVVSNPPYVPVSDAEALDVEVRDHEPSLALFAGSDGLAIYRRLIPQAFHVLVPGGGILLEIGFGQAEQVTALLEAGGFFDVEFVPDLQGIPRVVTGRRGKD